MAVIAETRWRSGLKCGSSDSCYFCHACPAAHPAIVGRTGRRCALGQGTGARAIAGDAGKRVRRYPDAVAYLEGLTKGAAAVSPPLVHAHDGGFTRYWIEGGAGAARRDASGAGVRGLRPMARVDLPAPFSPRRAWISPGRRSRSTSPSTSTPPKCLEMPRASTSAGWPAVMHPVPAARGHPRRSGVRTSARPRTATGSPRRWTRHWPGPPRAPPRPG